MFRTSQIISMVLAFQMREKEVFIDVCQAAISEDPMIRVPPVFSCMVVDILRPAYYNEMHITFRKRQSA